MAGEAHNLIEVAIEADSRADQEKLVRILDMMTAIDIYVGMSCDPEAGLCLLKGPDELYLDYVVDRLRRDFRIALRVGCPQVAYRETPSRACEVDYTHKRQRDGSGEFARIRVAFEPGARGSGYSFENRVVGEAVPREFAPGVEKGLEAARQIGCLAGFPVIDFKAMLLDGAYHDVDSSVIAFESAARAAFKQGMQKAHCLLLEPIMKVEIVLPFGFDEKIIHDLDTRRVEHRGLETRARFEVLHALVPLANMFGYADTLNRLSHRRAVYGMTFDHYQPIPQRPDDDSFRPAVGMRA